MVAPYTATDLIRVMEHEMHHNHAQAERRRSWLRRGTGRTGGDQSPVSTAAGEQSSRREDGRSLLSLFSKPAA